MYDIYNLHCKDNFVMCAEYELSIIALYGITQWGHLLLQKTCLMGGMYLALGLSTGWALTMKLGLGLLF